MPSSPAGPTIGEETLIFPFANIGDIPQDLKYAGERTRLIVGARNRIREGVTMNTGTEHGGGVTRVGDDGLFMAGAHVAHDAQIGNRVILVNNASIAGHCVIDDDVIVGGLSGVHQWVRVGRGAIIGAVTMVTNDVIPYGLVQGPRGVLDGLNLVGLKRAAWTGPTSPRCAPRSRRWRRARARSRTARSGWAKARRGSRTTCARSSISSWATPTAPT
jgi:acyl-ACP--UDP-N-acetylglucosamine O-acyltransferase